MAMIDALRSAILRVDGRRVQEVFASTDQVCVEMADLSNEVAAEIVATHDWRDLTRIATFTGDGAQDAFPKPADYDRMLLASDVDDTGAWLWGYSPFASVNDWMRAKSGEAAWIEPGGWIIVGGAFQFWPPPRGGATFPYISRMWARNEAGVEKARLTSDQDDFFLGDRIMTLGCVWRWKHQKGLDYGEDMVTYGEELARLQGRDRGSFVLRSPRGRIPGARVGYVNRG